MIQQIYKKKIKSLKRVIINRSAFITIWQHAIRGLPNEIGGLLIGMPCLNQNNELILWIVAASESKCKSSRAFVVIQPDAYDKGWHIIDKTDTHLYICGWYHSHPDYGIFLSKDDKDNMFTHWHNFYNVALVVDPIQKTWGVFRYYIINNTGKFKTTPTFIFNGSYSKYWAKLIKATNFSIDIENIHWINN